MELARFFKGTKMQEHIFSMFFMFACIVNESMQSCDYGTLQLEIGNFAHQEKNGLYFPYLSQWFKGRRNERKLFKRNVGLKTKIKWGIMEPSAEGSDLATKVLRLKTLTLSWWPNH